MAASADLAAARLPPRSLPLVALLLGAATGVATHAGPAATAAAIVAASLIGLVVVRPWTVVVAGCVIGPLCSGLRRGAPLPMLRAGEAALLVAAAVAVLVHRPVTPVRRQHWFEWSLGTYVVATMVLGAVSTQRSGGALGTEQLGLLAVPAFHAAAYLAGRLVSADPGRARRVLRGLLVGSGGLSVLAMAQTLHAPLVTQLLAGFADQSGYTSNVDAGFVARATGLFNHWHLLAGYLVVMVTLAVSLTLRPDRRVLSSRALTWVLALDVAALTLTLTYTAFAGALAAVAIVGALHGRGAVIVRRIAVVVAVAAIVFSGALAHRAHDQFAGGGRTSTSSLLPQTVQFRLAVWEEQFLPAIAERPVLGWGTTAPDRVLWPFTESVYVTLLLRGGAVLLALYAAMWIAMVLRAADVTRRRARAPQGVQPVVAPAIIAVAVVMLPMQALFPYFTSPGVPHLLLLLCGMAFSPEPLVDQTRSSIQA